MVYDNHLHVIARPCAGCSWPLKIVSGDTRREGKCCVEGADTDCSCFGAAGGEYIQQFKAIALKLKSSWLLLQKCGSGSTLHEGWFRTLMELRGDASSALP